MLDSRSRRTTRRRHSALAVLRHPVAVALAAATFFSALLLLAACSPPSGPPASKAPTSSMATPPGSAPTYSRETTATATPPPPATEPWPPAALEPPQEPPAALAEQASTPIEALAAPAPVAAPSAPAAAAAPEPPPTVVASGNASYVNRVVQLINAARQQEGLMPLSPTSALMEVAQRQAQAMAETNRLSHTSPDGSTVEGRVQAAGYGAWSVLGEVCASGSTSPEEVVASWLASPEHRARLLDSAFREIGAGYYYLSGSSFGHWWVVDLAAH